jgi:hypothetical protein
MGKRRLPANGIQPGGLKGTVDGAKKTTEGAHSEDNWKEEAFATSSLT